MLSTLHIDPATLPVSAEEWEQRLLAMHGATDADEFIDCVFRLIEATVECEWVLVNLRPTGRIPEAARDSLGRCYSAELFAHISEVNPAVRHILLRPGIRMVTTRELLPANDAELRKLPFYERCMKPFAWRHCVSLVFWTLLPPLPVCGFNVFRPASQPDFSKAELERLRALHPHIATSLKRLRKQLLSESTKTAVGDDSRTTMVVDWHGQLVNHGVQSEAELQRWCAGAKELPGELMAACRTLGDAWLSLVNATPGARLEKKQIVLHPTQPRLRAEIALLDAHSTDVLEPGFVIRLRETTSADKLVTLTPAEREAVLLAAQCLDNQQIADRLSINISAVKTRLHSAFRKLGVVNRSQLVAMVK